MKAWTPSELKTAALQGTTFSKLKDKPQLVRKYLQVPYLRKDLNPDCYKEFSKPNNEKINNLIKSQQNF